MSSSVNNATNSSMSARRSVRFRSKVLSYWEFEKITSITTSNGNKTAVVKDVPGEGTVILEDQDHQTVRLSESTSVSCNDKSNNCKAKRKKKGKKRYSEETHPECVTSHFLKITDGQSSLKKHKLYPTNTECFNELSDAAVKASAIAASENNIADGLENSPKRCQTYSSNKECINKPADAAIAASALANCVSNIPNCKENFAGKPIQAAKLANIKSCKSNSECVTYPANVKCNSINRKCKPALNLESSIQIGIGREFDDKSTEELSDNTKDDDLQNNSLELQNDDNFLSNPDDAGYSTGSESSCNCLPGNVLRFVPLQPQNGKVPTGEFYVARALADDGRVASFLKVSKGYIAFRTPSNMIILVLSGTGTLKQLTNEDSSVTVMLRPNCELQASKGARVIMKPLHDGCPLIVCLLTFVEEQGNDEQSRASG